VLPTLLVPPPTLAAADPDGRLLLGTAPVNGAGLPSLALPVAHPGGPPASLQVIGRAHGEEELVALGRRLEAAIASRT
jgi:Asp-tRNA(Asn)/Glu-tRNA(Gln) amidotransferase A subunit family amidase